MESSRAGNLALAKDAAGGCDGAKNGKTGFHTEHEAQPWWRVDLGEVYRLSKVVLWNRTDDPITAPRGRFVVVLLSTDDQHWQEAYRHGGTVFYGYPEGNPLTGDLRGQQARFVKIQLANTEYLHLDEVEVFGVDTPDRNLALDRPATQSSVSQWSTPPIRPLALPEPDLALWRTAAASAAALAEATLAFVPPDKETPAFRAQLAVLRTGLENLKPGADEKSVFLQLRWLRRHVLFRHPLLNFERLLVNKRPPPVISHMVDQYLGRWSRPGPGLFLVTGWRDTPAAQPLLREPLPTGSVLHPDLSFDGQRVLFSYCDHTVAELTPEETAGCEAAMGVGGLLDWVRQGGRRRFLLYEARIADGSVRQLTGTDRDLQRTEDGRQAVLVEDFDPCYLPDGGIAFVSTRCQSFGRCHWGRCTPTFVLYRAEGDGSNIRRLSPGELNEWDPAVLHDGRIVFARWDYVNRHNTFFQSLWVGRPDGTEVAHVYGNLSRNPCRTSESRAIPGSDRLVCTATAHHSYTAGSLVEIDPDRGQEGLEPLRRITPEVQFPETDASVPGDYYARRGRLVALLLGPHRQYVEPDRESLQRIIDSLDLNGQYYGDYSWNRPERRTPPPEAVAALRADVSSRCEGCHAGRAHQPLAALLNVALPEESRVVQAPLSRTEGGWGQCTGIVWSRQSPEYAVLLETVREAAGPEGPADVAGTCGQVPCRCGGCWVKKLRNQPHSPRLAGK